MEKLPIGIERKEARSSIGIVFATSLAVMAVLPPAKVFAQEAPEPPQETLEAQEQPLQRYFLREYMSHMRTEGGNLSNVEHILANEDLPEDTKKALEEFRDVLKGILDALKEMQLRPDLGLVFATDEQMEKFRKLHSKMDELVPEVNQRYQEYQQSKPEERET